MTDEEAPQYREALRSQMAVAQAILHGLGYRARISAAAGAATRATWPRWTGLAGGAGQASAQAAGFAVQAKNAPRWNWRWTT